MKQQNNTANEIEAMGEVAMSKTELFFEENGKKISIAIVSIAAVAAALFGYKSIVMDPAEKNAAAAMYSAQSLFESAQPDYQVALEGDAATTGFLQVIQDYKSTPSANLAKHYAGICYIKLGDNDSAAKYLKEYKAQKGIPAQIINAQNLALQADILVDNGNYNEATTLFERAATISTNNLTTPLYLRKAGMAAQAAGDIAKAKSLFTQVTNEYPNSAEARNAEKYLGALQSK